MVIVPPPPGLAVLYIQVFPLTPVRVGYVWLWAFVAGFMTEAPLVSEESCVENTTHWPDPAVSGEFEPELLTKLPPAARMIALPAAVLEMAAPLARVMLPAVSAMTWFAPKLCDPFS